MSSPRKYASGITALDLNTWLQQVTVHHGLTIKLELSPSYTSPTSLRCRVALYDTLQDTECTSPLKTGQTLIKVAGEGQWANMMHLCHLVLNDYQADPWNWSLRDRKREAASRKERPE